MDRWLSACLVVFLGLFGYVAPLHAQSLGDLADREVPLEALETQVAGKRAWHVLRSTAVEDAYTGVVLQGVSASPDLEGQVRFETPQGWSDWYPLYLTRSATDAFFMAAYRGDAVRTGQRFELRFSTEAGAEVRILGAGVFDARTDADAMAPATPLAPYARPVPGIVTPPHLTRRSEWGAAPFRGTPSPLAPSSYRYLTLHHAAGFGAETYEEGIQQVRAIQDFHQNGRGWSDIGYHFVLNEQGDVYQGRPFLDESVPFAEGPPLVLGAHVGGNNTGNIGICMLGCYHPPEGSFCRDEMAPATLDSLVTLMAFLSETYDVPPANIRGHRDFSATACPGDNNYALLDVIRARVEELLRVGNAPVGRATIAATADADGVVRLSWDFLEDNGIVSYRIERTAGDSTTTVAEGTGAVPASWVDTTVPTPGPVAYRLYATGAGGREQLLAATEVLVAAPAAYVLTESFPNPFARTTTIRYFLQQDGLVTLRVFDGTGRQVRELVNAYQAGERWYTSPFDAAGLGSGVYYYRLIVEGFSGTVYDQTHTLVVVR